MTANILEKQGKVREAIEIVTALDSVRQAEYIKHYLGLLHLSNSNFTEAFNYFKAALSLQPDHVPSLIEVATIISDLSPKQSIALLKYQSAHSARCSPSTPTTAVPWPDLARSTSQSRTTSRRPWGCTGAHYSPRRTTNHT